MIFRYFFAILLLFFIYSCNPENNSTKIHGDDLMKDTANLKINDYANFLSGNNCSEFEEVQKKDFYKNYQKSISTTWNYFYINQLTMLTNWSNSEGITSKSDSITVFYPFSGPDFSFVYGFFPHAKNYIMVGLENIGIVPKFNEYSDLEIEQYLNSLSASMTDFFLYGYFSTQNMKTSFRQADMNGIIHPLLFFINRTDNYINSLNYFTIDKYGKTKIVESFDPLSKDIKGVKITFTGNYGEKSLYYIQYDLSNQNFSEYPEFVTFISNFGQKNVFLKSASYLLQSDDFSEFRKLLNHQSEKIVQDDSGFGYGFLIQNGYIVKLYGNYAHTLNIFNEYFQKDLKQAFDKQGVKKLPFRFGYNIPFDETTIIFATKNNVNISNYPFYSVQFKMSWNKIESDSFPSSLKDLDYYFDEGYYKYISGKFATLEEAEKYLENIINKGYQDAFVVYFTADGKQVIE